VDAAIRCDTNRRIDSNCKRKHWHDAIDARGSGMGRGYNHTATWHESRSNNLPTRAKSSMAGQGESNETTIEYEVAHHGYYLVMR